MSAANDLSQIKAEIDVRLLDAGLAVRSPSGGILLEQGTSDRLFKFAESAIKRSIPAFDLSAFLDLCPPERRWTRLRMRLSDEALKALHRRLGELTEKRQVEAA